jgi:fumarylacetoacetate (FAA) hydrolase
MKLATLDNGKRDGKLIIISSDNKNYVDASHIAKNLQEALDNWEDCKSKLEKLYQQLNENNLPEGSLNIFLKKKDLKSETVDTTKILAPLPRAYEWIGKNFI